MSLVINSKVIKEIIALLVSVSLFILPQVSFARGDDSLVLGAESLHEEELFATDYWLMRPLAYSEAQTGGGSFWFFRSVPQGPSAQPPYRPACYGSSLCAADLFHGVAVA